MPLLKCLDPALQLVVALPLTCHSRTDALLQRTLQGLTHPPGQLPVFALSATVRWSSSSTRAALLYPWSRTSSFSSAMGRMCRRSPRLCPRCRVRSYSWLFFSFSKSRPSLRSAAVRPFPRSPATFLGHVIHPHFNRPFEGLMSLGSRSDRPADVIAHVWRCHCRPERTLSESVHFSSPVEGRFASD